MNLRSLLCCTGTILLTSLWAWAEPCTTSSKGLVFFENNRDINQASDNVVSECQRTNLASYFDCRDNLSCGSRIRNPYPSGRVSCNTHSKSLTFHKEGRKVGSTAEEVVEQCQRNQYTSYFDCKENVNCEDAGSWGSLP